MPQRAAGDGPTEDLSPTALRWLLVVASIGGVWLTHRGLLARTPAGAEVMAHVARTDAGLHLFRQGRLDGWFPTFGSGSRLFAVSGPGLALASGAVRVLSLGVIHPARSFALLGSLSIAMMPPAMVALSRELGLTRRAAAIAAVLALFVGTSAGGGLAGLYGSGLVPLALAVPVQLLVLAGLVRIARTGSVAVMAAAALGVGWLVIVHPGSLVVVLVMVPGLVLTVRRPWSARRLLRVAGAGLWGVAIVAWWVIPAVRARALRGPVTELAAPTLGEIVTGGTLFPRLLALAVAVALVISVGLASRPGAPRRWLAAPLSALVLVVVGRLAADHGWAPRWLWVPLADGGLVVAGCLLLLPLAVVTSAVLGRLRAPAATRVTAGFVAALALMSPVILRGPLNPPQSAPSATADLQAVARLLKVSMPEPARQLLVEPPPDVRLGTSEPSRWLASVTGRATAQQPFPAATRERGAARLPSAVLTRLPPPESLGPLRRAGITHVVVTTPDPGDQLVDQPGYRLLATHGPLAVYLVDPAAGSPPVRELLQPDRGTPVADGARLRADLRHASAESYRWHVTATSAVPDDAGARLAVVAPVAFDPGWRASVDGRPVAVTRSGEGLVRVDVPAGSHDVALRYTGSRNDVPGLVIGAAAGFAAVVVLVGATPFGTRVRRRAAPRRTGRP